MFVFYSGLPHIYSVDCFRPQAAEWIKFAIPELEIFCKKYEEEENREVEKLRQRYVCLSVCLSVCMSVCSSLREVEKLRQRYVCLSVCLSVCLYVSLFVFITIMV